MEIDAYSGLDVMSYGSMIDFYRSDPVMAAYDLLGVDLAPVQRIILRDMWHKSYTITVAGRGLGKTFLLAVNGVLHALLYPGYRVGLIGPSFRQSKMMFAEVEKLYNRSPILKEACEKKPTRGADTCFLTFKSTPTSNGSRIEALPIGVDGAKIRGSRFYLIEIDELAQMPTQIIDMVIRPMAAVSLEPMQKVREMERQHRLIEAGLAQEDQFETGSANKMVMASSGYFKFNHMWDRMRSYWKAMREEGSKSMYAVHQMPYQLLPKGFLDTENINEAKRTMSNIEFTMEYEATMASDSDGFFKASLIDKCSRNSTFSTILTGERGREYVMGVDPNQGGGGRNAMCGVVLVERNNPAKLVYVNGLSKNTTQNIVTAVQDLTERFNVVKIFMDSQGGGKAVRDLLQEGYGNRTKILDIEDETNLDQYGKRILHMINPSSQWIADANFDTLALLENKELLFPMAPLSSSEIEEKQYEFIKILKSQLLSIVVSQTARGLRHFDTPKKGQSKDLYSAFVLAGWGIREMIRSVDAPLIELFESGLVRSRNVASHFSKSTAGAGPKFQSALLKRKN